jgi:hypothetical protein
MYYAKKILVEKFKLYKKFSQNIVSNANNSNQYNHVKIELYYAKNIYREICKYTVISPRDK